MTGAIIFYDNSGSALAEVGGTATRAWLLNKFSQAQIWVPLSEFESSDYPSGKLHLSDVQFGNFVVVTHDRVGDWVGVIEPDMGFDEQSGQLVLTAYSGEYMFLKRMGNLTGEGTRGQIFRRLVEQANDVPGIGFYTGQLFLGGEVLTNVARQDSIYDAIIGKLSGERAGNDWGVTPGYDQNGRLFLECHWFGTRGVYRPNFLLEEGHNLKVPDGNAMRYTGEIVNEVEVIGDKERPLQEGKPQFTARDEASIAAYGVHQLRKFEDATDQTELGDVATTILAEQAQPRKQFSVEVLDVNNSFDFIQLGDVIPLKLHRAGWLGDMLGMEPLIRVTGKHFDELQGWMTLIVEESVL